MLLLFNLFHFIGRLLLLLEKLGFFPLAFLFHQGFLLFGERFFFLSELFFLLLAKLAFLLDTLLVFFHHAQLFFPFFCLYLGKINPRSLCACLCGN